MHAGDMIKPRRRSRDIKMGKTRRQVHILADRQQELLKRAATSLQLFAIIIGNRQQSRGLCRQLLLAD